MAVFKAVPREGQALDQSQVICKERDTRVLRIRSMENEHWDLSLSINQMKASQRHKSVGGEILSARKIISFHFASALTECLWDEDSIVTGVAKQDVLSKSQVSVESLVYFWNIWKDKIVGVFEYLVRLETNRGVGEFQKYGEFCMSSLCVCRHLEGSRTIYYLLNSDADWVINAKKISVGGNLFSIDVLQFVSDAKSYWSSELLSVGFRALHKIEELYKNAPRDSDSILQRCRILIAIYEAAKFLLDSEFLRQKSEDCSNYFKRLIAISTNDFYGLVFPLNWKSPVAERLSLFRETDRCKSFLKQVAAEYTKNSSSHVKLGNIAMVVLGSVKPSNEIVGNIQSPQWKWFLETLSRSRFPTQDLILKLRQPLLSYEFISPRCFVYLVDRLVIWASSSKGFFVTSRSSFVEWLIFEEIQYYPNDNNNWSNAEAVASLQYAISVIKKCLLNKGSLVEWIRRHTTRVDDYYPLIVSRMVTIICTIHANFGVCSVLLLELLRETHISAELPPEFRDLVKFGSSNLNPNGLCGVFKKFGNPMVVMSFGGSGSIKSPITDAISVDMKIRWSKNDLIRRLFAKSFENGGSVGFWEMFQGINSSPQALKVDVEKYIRILMDVIISEGREGKYSSGEICDMVVELKHLSAALDVRNMYRVQQLSSKLSSRRPRMERVLNELFGQHGTDKGKSTVSRASIAAPKSEQSGWCSIM